MKDKGRCDGWGLLTLETTKMSPVGASSPPQLVYFLSVCMCGCVCVRERIITVAKTLSALTGDKYRCQKGSGRTIGLILGFKSADERMQTRLQEKEMLDDTTRPKPQSHPRPQIVCVSHSYKKSDTI